MFNQGNMSANQNVKPEIRLMVPSDRLSASIQVKSSGQEQKISEQEILAFLSRNNIVFGILGDRIRDFCKSGNYAEPLLCARGVTPVDEKRGTLEYRFHRDPKLKPLEREDGTVDYQNLGIVQNVAKGDVLCRIIPPVPGKDGTDVYGHAVPCRKGVLPPLPGGSNTRVSEDGLTLTAAVDGCVEYKNAIVSINEVFNVRGDVGNASGNVDFVGTVVVQGDVREGFSIRAGGDIEVRGIVEGARLEAGGNIVIACGMNGMNRGTLTADGSISVQYLENATTKCGGDIRADSILNSCVTAGGSIVVRGRNGLLAGGHYTAGKSVVANTIGRGGGKTELVVTSQALDGLLTVGNVEDLNSLRAERSEEQKKGETLRSQMVALELFMQKDPRNLRGKMLLKQLEMQQEAVRTQIGSLEMKIRQMETAGESGLIPADFKIVAMRVAHMGTKITVGTFTRTLETDYSGTKFYAGRDEIASKPVLPSDGTD